MTLRLRPEAISDIIDAARWYEERQPGLGAAFVEEVDRLLVRVADAPFRYPPARATLRRAIVGRFPYAVYFGLDPVGVVIFAVLHQRRDQNVLDERRVKKSD